jgi:hypothetical protein
MINSTTWEKNLSNMFEWKPFCFIIDDALQALQAIW